MKHVHTTSKLGILAPRPRRFFWSRGLEAEWLWGRKCKLRGSVIKSNDDVDLNENGKKGIGLDWQNNNFAPASRFSVHFLAVSARLRRENAGFLVFWRT